MAESGRAQIKLHLEHGDSFGVSRNETWVAVIPRQHRGVSSIAFTAAV